MGCGLGLVMEEKEERQEKIEKAIKEEKDKILSRIFWDTHIDVAEINMLLDTPVEEETGIRQIILYRRLLTSCDWYTLIKLLPLEKMKRILSEPILEGIYPDDVKRKYQYARKYLSL